MHEPSNLRRSFLRLAGLGALSLASSGIRPATAAADVAEADTASTRLPPYPGEQRQQPGSASLANIWSASGLLRRDIRPNLSGEGLPAAGLRMDLTIKLQTTGRTQKPIPNAAVYIWHSDAQGEYSVYGRNDTDYLRGIGISDSNGRLTFTTVYPGTYRGREPHIHFEVYPSLEDVKRASACILRSRILFPEATTREIYKSNLVYRPSLKQFDELVFGRPGTSPASATHATQIAMLSGVAKTAVRASITIPIIR